MSVNHQVQAAVEAASASAASSMPAATKGSIAIAGAAATTSWLGSVAGNDFVALLGATAAVVGAIGSMLITWYYKRQETKLRAQETRFKEQEDARAAELHTLEMALKRRKLEDCIEGGDCG